jgi:uncharacterized protein (DUF2336 family)
MTTTPGTVSRLKQLIEVAKDGGDERRRDLLREITDVFMTTPDKYTTSEMQHFDVILSKVAESVEIALRREIAEKLADVKTAPRNLIKQLAGDDITVARPVLERSSVLSEEDLVRIIRQRGQDHMQAIARRRNVPEAVSSELVERGGKDVLISLAENQGATIGQDTLQKLVQHSRTVTELQGPMAGRFDLPPQLLTQMYFFVSSALKREILNRSDMLDPSLIDEAVENNRAKIISKAVTEVEADVSSAHRFIEDRVRTNSLNESLLKELIEARRSTEFLLGFAHYVGVDTSTAQRILADRSWESLALACRAANLERSTFAKIVFGLQRGESEQNKALRILDLYLKVPAEAAERVMRFWRVRNEINQNEQSKTREKASLHSVADRIAASRGAA